MKHVTGREHEHWRYSNKLISSPISIRIYGKFDPPPKKNPNFNWKQDEISATFRGIARLSENNNSEGTKPSHKYTSLLQALKIERRVNEHKWTIFNEYITN